MGKQLLILNGAILLGCAFFIAESYYVLITALLFFLPLLDRQWRPICFYGFKNHFYIWGLIGLCYFSLLIINEEYIAIALNIIVFTALPEEWFFRCYFLQRLELFNKNLWLANGVCSIFFAVLHIPTQGWLGLLVFFPSLLFGYVYQKSKNLVLVVLLHGLSNLVYIMYLQNL